MANYPYPQQTGSYGGEPQMISTEYDRANPKGWVEIAVRQVLGARSIDYQTFLHQYTTSVYNLEVVLVGDLDDGYDARVDAEKKRLDEDATLNTSEREFYLARFKFKQLVKAIKGSMPEERDLEV